MNSNALVSLLLFSTILIWLVSGLWFPEETESVNDLSVREDAAPTQVQAKFFLGSRILLL